MRREPLGYPQGELVVVIDCAQLDRSAEFWTAVLGYVRDGVATGRYVTEHGWRWHVMADPDGNEFCVLQPPASYWAG